MKTAVISDDAKEQEALKNEMAELRNGEAITEVKPAGETEVKTVPEVEPEVKTAETVSDTDKLKEDALSPEAKELITKLEGEKNALLSHKDKLEKDNFTLREKRRQDLETLAVLQSKIKPEGYTPEGRTDIDPEVEKIIRSTVAPELEQVRAESAKITKEIREQRANADQERVIAREGKEKYDAAYAAFVELIMPESHLYDPAIEEAFMNTMKPAEFIFKVGLASGGLDSYIENVRKETTEKVKKETLEGLKNSANKVIPSLSSLAGSKPTIKDGSNSLRTEMNELRNV